MSLKTKMTHFKGKKNVISVHPYLLRMTNHQAHERTQHIPSFYLVYIK